MRLQKLLILKMKCTTNIVPNLQPQWEPTLSLLEQH